METQKGRFSAGEIEYSYFKIELENAVEVLLFSKEEKLGTVAVGTPLPDETRAASSTILGDRIRTSAVVAEALAERFAAQTGKIAIVSFHQPKDIEVPDLLKAAFDHIPI